MTKRRTNPDRTENDAADSGSKELRAFTVARPAVRGPAALLIEVKADGGCGSDHSIWAAPFLSCPNAYAPAVAAGAFFGAKR